LSKPIEKAVDALEINTLNEEKSSVIDMDDF